MTAQKQNFKNVSYILGQNWPQTRDQARALLYHIGNVQNWTAVSVQYLIQL